MKTEKEVNDCAKRAQEAQCSEDRKMTIGFSSTEVGDTCWCSFSFSGGTRNPPEKRTVCDK